MQECSLPFRKGLPLNLTGGIRGKPLDISMLHSGWLSCVHVLTCNWANDVGPVTLCLDSYLYVDAQI